MRSATARILPRRQVENCGALSRPPKRPSDRLPRSRHGTRVRSERPRSTSGARCRPRDRNWRHQHTALPHRCSQSSLRPKSRSAFRTTPPCVRRAQLVPQQASWGTTCPSRDRNVPRRRNIGGSLATQPRNLSRPKRPSRVRSRWPYGHSEQRARRLGSWEPICPWLDHTSHHRPANERAGDCHRRPKRSSPCLSIWSCDNGAPSEHRPSSGFATSWRPGRMRPRC